MKLQAITFDIDWAPDWCIEMCVDMCEAAGIRSTFFVTHDSAILERIRGNSMFEIGIHPNFLPGSTHGSDMKEIMEHCFEIVPEARSIRTHGLVQSTIMFQTLADNFPSIETDVSLLLPFHKNLFPTDLYIGVKGKRITRIPYVWEDDIMAEWPKWNWDSPPINSDGVVVYDFHPIHVALNTSRMSNYLSVRHAAKGALQHMSKANIARFINNHSGTRTFLENVLMSLQNERTYTISEITGMYRNGKLCDWH